MRTTDDAALLERVSARDEDALVAIYHLYGSRVLSLAYRILHDRAAAEEVVQDTFWKLWQRPDLFEPARGVLLAWLYTVGRNLALDRKRRKRRRLIELIVENFDFGMRGAAVPEMSALADPMLARRMQAAMDALPADQREVIELAFFRGLSQSEISHELGTPLGTVKTRLRLGISKLREALSCGAGINR